MLKKRYALIFIAASTFANAEIINSTEAVSVIQKEKIYSQKILKNLAMINLDNFYDNPYEDLDDTIELFSENLDNLIAFTKDAKIKKDLERIKKEWTELNDVMEEEADADEEKSREEKNKLIQEKEKELKKILSELDTVFKEISKKLKVNKRVEVCGNQQMLSQKVAALYLIKSANIENKDIDKDLLASLDEFKKNLEWMKKNKKDSPVIDEEIKKIEKNFLFLDMMKNSKKFIPTIIYKKSKIILSSLEAIQEEVSKGGK